MTLSRRDFLKLSGLLTAMTATGCRDALTGDSLVLPPLPDDVSTPMPPPAITSDRLLRLINRGGYGARPGELAAARTLGFDAYLEQQLNPDTIGDGPVDQLIADLDLYHETPQTLLQYVIDDELEPLQRAIYGSTVSRALFSRKQLAEAMVEFWSDHFHIYIQKRQPLYALKIVDDREVIRPNALGSFRDLLAASMRSPAMLLYLDNAQNLAAAPNENYARELLELHTLGVNGGYNEADVQAVARALTGLTLYPQRDADQRGTGLFANQRHDQDAKTILGVDFPAGQGEQDIEQLLDLLSSHPSTANHIATKLVRRFVADEPPETLVSAVANTFMETDGDIREMLRTVFNSDEFASSPAKLRRPYSFTIAALRALDVSVGANPALSEWLRMLGQVPFMWPAPNGFPDIAPAWTGTLLARWNFAIVLTNGFVRDTEVLWDGLPASDASVATWADFVLNSQLSAETLAHFTNTFDNAPFTDNSQQRAQAIAAMLLASPNFQWI